MMEGKTVDMITFNRVGPEAVTNYHGFSCFSQCSLSSLSCRNDAFTRIKLLFIHTYIHMFCMCNVLVLIPLIKVT